MTKPLRAAEEAAREIGSKIYGRDLTKPTAEFMAEIISRRFERLVKAIGDYMASRIVGTSPRTAAEALNELRSALAEVKGE